MDSLTVNPIGAVHVSENGFQIELLPAYRKGLAGLAGFGHLTALWWFSGCDDPASRASLSEEHPYAKGPQNLGVFATRSPRRPNPLAISCAGIIGLDEGNGVIRLDYLDADDGSPVLDIKPYTPSLDRVEHPAVPVWCSHWPESVEASGDFDWEREISF